MGGITYSNMVDPESQLCINWLLVTKHQLPLCKLSRPIKASNANRSANAVGLITDFVDLELEIGSAQGLHQECISLPVTNLGQGSIFLGHDWLHSHNPEIDWVADWIGFTCCPQSCSMIASIDKEPQVGYEGLWHMDIPDEPKVGAVKPDDLPPELRDYLDVFNVSNFGHLLER